MRKLIANKYSQKLVSKTVEESLRQVPLWKTVSI